MNNEDRYFEEWTLIQGDTKHTLNDKQSKILKEAIKSGNRGMVVFDDLVVNIPFIKEFYLEKRTLKPEYQIKAPPTEEELRYEEYSKMTPEQREEYNRKRLESYSLLKKKADALNTQKREEIKKIYKKMTVKEFNKRREFLLKQAETLT